jgi:3-phosphoshikimate 1-carboxyvinyltransferase
MRLARLEEHFQPRAAAGGARQGDTTLHGVLGFDDTRVMRDALAALGVTIDTLERTESLRVHGIGAGRGFPVKAREIFLGNSGTSARSLAGVLALADGDYELKGGAAHARAPIGDLVDALRRPCAQVSWIGNAGLPAARHRAARARSAAR